MNEFVNVAKTSELDESGKLCLEVGDRFIVIVCVDEQYYCIDDICTHDGGPLGEGPVVGNCLVCPRHGAQFDIRSGEAVTMPATEPTAKHDVRIDGESILVRISE